MFSGSLGSQRTVRSVRSGLNRVITCIAHIQTVSLSEKKLSYMKHKIERQHCIRRAVPDEKNRQQL